MKKLLPVTMTAVVSLTLVSCSSEGTNNDTRVTVTTTFAPDVTPAMIDTMAINACFDEINESVNRSGNEVDSLRWSGTPEVDAPNGLEGSAGVSGKAFINTSAGIPWEHEISCLVAMNGGNLEVLFASAKVPSLNK